MNTLRLISETGMTATLPAKVAGDGPIDETFMPVADAAFMDRSLPCRELNEDADSLRTWTGHGRPRPGHGRGQGLTADAAAGMARTRLRTGHGHGRGVDADWLRAGRGRGLATGTVGWPGDYADIPRPNRDHFADAMTFAGEGVRLVLS